MQKAAKKTSPATSLKQGKSPPKSEVAISSPASDNQTDFYRNRAKAMGLKMPSEFYSFVDAGGVDCIDYFDTFFTKWRKSGKLPSMLSSENEILMINQMYHMWAETQFRVERRPSSSALSAAVYTREFAMNARAAIAECIADIKRLGCDNVITLASQLEVLILSEEPTKSHALGILSALSSEEFLRLDIPGMERMAASGDPSYAIILALLYDQKKNELPECGKLSVKHYLQAVNRYDSPIAAMQLGAKHLRGDGVKQDNKLAFRWYRSAASLENPIAQHKLGYFYDEGLPGACEVDVQEAVKWYTLAAEVMPDSVHNLAKLYEDGREGPSFRLEPDIKQVPALAFVLADWLGFYFRVICYVYRPRSSTVSPLPEASRCPK
jgi:hypothetical protein